MARLIDADKLNVYKAWVEIKTDDGAVIYAGKRKIVLADDVADAPAVDPVKHGHWIAHGKSIIGVPVERCSECEEWSCGFNTKYCSKCGAKMDGERREDGKTD